MICIHSREIFSEDIPDPQAIPAYLISIGRSDAFKGRAYLGIALSGIHMRHQESCDWEV